MLAAILVLAPAALGQSAPQATPEPIAVPPMLAQPLGNEDQPVVVPYADLVGAAERGALNAAVVDTANFWVAAVDERGRLLAAQIPRPLLGGGVHAGAATADASALPGSFMLADTLREEGVAVLPPFVPEEDEERSALANTLRFLAFPLIIVMLIATFLIIRRMIRGPSSGGGARGRSGHGKMRKNAQVEPPPTRFADVAGCDESVEELQELVVFLNDPERFARVGAKLPRGVILHGPPGTGKTMLAKAVAGEAGVPFYAVSGSDFVDMYVGVGASRVRDLFTQARAQESGAIIFFDEIDAIGRARGGGAGGDSEREATLNQLLVELDGFGSRDRLIVIAATNRLDMLDQALLRPGRFDRRVQVGLPAENGRLAILRLHSAHMPIADPESLCSLARVTAGFAGADLANILNEAAIMAARDGRDRIQGGDLDEGMLRAVAGPERRDRRIAEGELETIAWHEAGHCLAAELCPTHQKAQRITITARGDTGGLALYGSEDRALTSQQHLHERMVVALSGRAAEQIGFGVISSGAANDIEQANLMAREAVERLGFSPRVGQVMAAAGPRGAPPLSGESRRAIDEEMARMVDAAYADAVGLLEHHRDELEALANALLRRESLDRSEIDACLSGATVPAARRGPARADALPTLRPGPQAPEPAAAPGPAVLAPAPEPVRIDPPAPVPPVAPPPLPLEREPAPPARRPARRGGLPRVHLPRPRGGSRRPRPARRRRRLRERVATTAARIASAPRPGPFRRRRRSVLALRARARDAEEGRTAP